MNPVLKDVLFVAFFTAIIWYKSPPRSQWLTLARIGATAMIFMIPLYDAQYLPAGLVQAQRLFRSVFPTFMIPILAITVFGTVKDSMPEQPTDTSSDPSRITHD